VALGWFDLRNLCCWCLCAVAQHAYTLTPQMERKQVAGAAAGCVQGWMLLFAVQDEA
jgi:hypothetical protein